MRKVYQSLQTYVRADRVAQETLCGDFEMDNPRQEYSGESASSDEVQRVADALHTILHDDASRPIIAGVAGGALYALILADERGITDDEVLDECCRGLIQCSISFSKKTPDPESIAILEHITDLSCDLFGEERSMAISKKIQEEQDALDEDFQEQLGRPPRKELN